eukprot:gnl/TRDRNA2_/TRDRNA2_181865_c0_seq1.p1 gnl/TRDRNA2_/TRDRNA2_181865_c0~~gnl/TRDRNA2_/TRDRNA2_181865_c0_seq1.p1  ORF type:complete len:506 (-),score=110.40 gnl/TRDRNA2_/TRDRNA2_181865_c0_seq1:252-1769(-)
MWFPPGLQADFSFEKKLRGQVCGAGAAGEEVPCYVRAPLRQEDDDPIDIAVIVVADAYGWNGGRIRQIVDHLSKHLDARVILPQLLAYPAFEGGNSGDGMPEGIDWSERQQPITKWLMQFMWDTHKPRLTSVMTFLRNNGAKRIACVGFGYGGWIVSKMHELGRDIVAAALIHPQVEVEETWHAEDLERLARKVTFPMLFLLAAEGEHNQMYAAGGHFFDTIKAKHKGTHTVHFKESKMQYGWVTHGDTDHPIYRGEAEQAVGMFTYYVRKFLRPPPLGANEATLRLACKEGDWQKVEQLLYAGVPAGGDDAADNMGLVPAHYAARAGNWKIIKQLHEAGADLNQVGGEGNETPLHVAANAKKAQAVRTLCDLDADPNCVDKALQTPMHLASRKGNTATVKHLLAARACQKAKDTSEQTALHLAAWHGHTQVVALLLSKGSDAEWEDIRGQTPYKRAAMFECKDVCDIFEIERAQRENEEAEKENAAAAQRASGVVMPTASSIPF